MSRRTLIINSVMHYWRTHLAVVAGVAVAVSVLAGALAVGDSVRASLRGLVDERLGRTGFAIVGQGFFRDSLAAEFEKDEAFAPSFAGTTALIVLEGALTHERSGRQGSRVQVYGVSEDFFPFHGVEGVAVPQGRQALMSPALAAELSAAPGDALLLRVQKPSAIPASTLAGRRDDTSRAIRVTVRETLPAEQLGEFSLRPQQDAIRAVFVPIARLQRDLSLPGRANLMLLSAADDSATGDAAERLLARTATFDDLGVKLLSLEAQHALSLESESGLLTDDLFSAAHREAYRTCLQPLGVLTYLANTIRIGDREMPYSVVTGIRPEEYGALSKQPAPNEPCREPEPRAGMVDSTARSEVAHPLWLNEWAARDLGATPGDEVTLEYFRWSDEAGLTTHSTTFRYAGDVPMSGAGGDRALTPEYPGLTDAPRIGDWDPPFPVDLKRIRPADERYWEQYRAAPKAFVEPSAAHEMWGSPVYGRATSIRIYVPRDRPLDEARDAFAAALRRAYTPKTAGLVVQPARAQAMAASRGATDFGEYFLYFSFFLVVAGLLLTGLFFKLGLEQRAREIGLLLALGYTPSAVRRLLFAESLILAVVGAALGIIGAIAFASAILFGLRTWWVDAVGTTRLTLAVTPATLVLGALGGLCAAVLSLAVTLRRLGAAAPRDLLSGLAVMADQRHGAALTAPRVWLRAAAGAIVAGGLMTAALFGHLGQTTAFFGAGAAVLVASVAALSGALRTRRRGAIASAGPAAVARLGARQATAHPGRTVLSVSLIAFATFVIVAVGAFRRGAPENAHDPASGTGGYALFAESAAPVMFDPGTPAGRAELALSEQELAGAHIERFRLRPGEDGSCLNLYKPTNPRIIAPTSGFVSRGGFQFATTIEASDAERRNPWLLLDRTFPDGAVPVIGDATSLQYVLHVPVGGDLLIPGPEGVPIVLRVVAALSDSVFQSELIISDAQFTRLFPQLEGYRFFLVRSTPGAETTVATALEQGLADYGFDAQSSGERLAAYHRVENTYLSTFQALGGLGLLLGTLGLGAILLRNVLERRRELALLRAVGFEGRALGLMVIAESLLLLIAGIGIGTASAVIAVMPAIAARGTSFPVVSTLTVLAAVLVAGLVASALATRVAAATPLLAALKTE